MFATIGYYICIPFAWLLRALYELTSSYGWALVLFTVVIKLIMLPFQMKSKKSMMRMSRFQPMIKEIQTRYKNNQVKMNEELQRLYAEEGVNPMSGCLWSFLPFPILIALYSIIRQPITRFMMLTTTAMQGVIDAVSAAGFDLAAIAMTANDGAVTVKDGLTQLQPYGQITLVKAAQELGVALPEGWIHMDFSFLGMDLTMIPSDVIGQIGTGGWAVIGVLLIPIVSGRAELLAVQGLHGRQSRRRGPRRPHRALDPHGDVDDAHHVPLDRLYPARLPRRVLDREQRSDARAGEGAQQVFQEEHGCGGRGA